MINHFLRVLLCLFVSINSYAQVEIEWEGSAWDISSGFNFTKGSNSKGDRSPMKPGIGWELSFSYSTNFLKYCRFNFGINYLQSHYSTYQIPETTYYSSGIIAVPLSSEYEFNFVGPFVGFQSGTIKNQYIYYGAMSLGLNTVKGSMTTNFHSGNNKSTYKYNFEGKFFLNVEFYGGVGYKISHFAFVGEPFINLSQASVPDPAAGALGYDFGFNWIVYGLRIKLEITAL